MGLSLVDLDHALVSWHAWYRRSERRRLWRGHDLRHLAQEDVLRKTPRHLRFLFDSSRPPLHVGQDVPGHSLHVSMLRRETPFSRRSRRKQVQDVAGRWADVQERYTESQDVVNLARMHHPDKPVAHHHHVQVGGRERAGKSLEGLIGDALEVRQRVLLGHTLQPAELAASTHQTEGDLRAVG